MKNKGILLGAVVACLLLLPASVANSADNPIQVAVTASGDTELLPALPGHRYRIHAISVIGSGSMTDSVSFYIHSGSQALVGTSSVKVMIDKSGVEAPAGFVLPESKYGWAVTSTANTSVAINLDDAQPVLVIIIFSVL